MTQSLLTTVDNPYNPFEQFVPWFMYDIEKGYYSCSKVARIANLSDDLSDVESTIAVNNAIDQIVLNDVTNTFKRVTQTLVMEE